MGSPQSESVKHSPKSGHSSHDDCAGHDCSGHEVSGQDWLGQLHGGADSVSLHSHSHDGHSGHSVLSQGGHDRSRGNRESADEGRETKAEETGIEDSDTAEDGDTDEDALHSHGGQYVEDSEICDTLGCETAEGGENGADGETLPTEAEGLDQGHDHDHQDDEEAAVVCDEDTGVSEYEQGGQ